MTDYNNEYYFIVSFFDSITKEAREVKKLYKAFTIDNAFVGMIQYIKDNKTMLAPAIIEAGEVTC